MSSSAKVNGILKHQARFGCRRPKSPNNLSIEGHTDSKPCTGGREYGNWELSTDRANAARRLMQHDGVRDDHVTQVRGYADQMPRKKDEPLDTSNRRISVIVQNLEIKPEEPERSRDQPSPPSQDLPKKE